MINTNTANTATNRMKKEMYNIYNKKRPQTMLLDFVLCSFQMCMAIYKVLYKTEWEILVFSYKHTLPIFTDSIYILSHHVNLSICERISVWCPLHKVNINLTHIHNMLYAELDLKNLKEKQPTESWRYENATTKMRRDALSSIPGATAAYIWRDCARSVH